ncbi:MAG: hypothetical protein HS111_24320 [Kofleriaceae bacterium]|nr:hypothetical protein [Kofleriaceae bacterium]MCL4224014.1 hypothetical protein [Myxococcales bacterium]
MAGLEWSERRLCDDGDCTGLVGNDGRCKVCGRASAFWGDERRRGMRDEPDEPDEPDEIGDGDARGARRAAAGDDDRRLCPDGDCTGILGIDGRCKVCGRAEPGRAAVASARARAADGDAADDDAADDDAADDAHHGEPAGDDPGDASDQRRLCPDGGCTGLLGPDGRCKVCGRGAE